MSNLRIVLYFTVMTVCSHSNIVGAAEIESSFPPNNAIDARAPFVGNAAELQGWQTIEIRFSDAMSGVEPGDFTLSEKGGDGIPPSIESVARIDSRTVLVILNEPLEPGTWIELSHVSSGTSISLGYLPGDVNGDGTVSPYADTLALIDCINIPDRCAPWQQDLDRSGQAEGESDRQTLFDLYRGAAESTAWAGVRMPQDVLAILTAAWFAKRDTSPGAARGIDEIHIRLDVTDLGPTEFGSVGVFDPAAFTSMLGVPVNPNDQLLLHIWARNNTATDILLRGLQFDPRASSFPYSLFGIDIDTGNQPLDGVPNLWFDYSELEGDGEELGLFPASGHPSTGAYIDFSNTLQGNPLIQFPQATVFAAQSGGPSVQIPMPPSQWVHLGAMPITVPSGTTSFAIDLLNLPNTGDSNFGAVIDFGFGVEPGDPVTKFASAADGMGVDGTIVYAPSDECGGLILYDGTLQQFQGSSVECCGNGIVESGETCDHGGDSATCDADCTIAECGDGTLNATAGEGCDDGLNNSDTEPDACRTTCVLPSCEDGVVDTGEACDDGGESAACDVDCTAAECGDGTLNATAGEVCDDAGDSATCDADCTIAECGDGTLNGPAGESCDDGLNNSDTQPDACRTNCSQAGCGDGVVDTGEDCDDGNLINGDGCSSSCEVEPSEPIPTVSTWSLIVLTILGMTVGTIMIGRPRRPVAA